MTHTQAAKALYRAESALMISLCRLKSTPAATYTGNVGGNIAAVRQSLDALKQAVADDNKLHGGGNTWHTKANALMLRSVHEEAEAVIAQAEDIINRYKSIAGEFA